MSPDIILVRPGTSFDDYRVTEQPLFAKRHIRLVCVGAGATGLEVAYKAERFLQDVEIQIYEKNNDVGGTWLENRYPGCTCDIPSHSYQFPWARNSNWTQFYSSSEEIWRYFKSVAIKFGLEKYVKFEHKIKTAKWNEERGVWDLTVQAPDGSKFLDHCEILVNGSGVLNAWKYPNIQGLDTFKGKLMHSANWEHGMDFKENTVAVIGGGSSAVQIIPSLQPDVKKLIPFLRSPVWITTGFGAKFAGPGGTNFTYSNEQKKTFNEDPEHYNQYCRELEGELNKRFTLMHLKSKDQASSRNLVASIMNEQLNNDTRLVKHLVPEFALGCRRMTPGSGYLQSLTKSNVDVITEDVVRLTEHGVVDASGTEHKVDVVVCATGFDTSFTPHFECIGRGGKSLKEQFGDFPKGYLGIMAENFPNLFLLIGPNGPASHASLLPILEWHTRYMFQMVTKLQEENIKCFDPKKEAIHDFYNHTHELMKRLVWSSACRSWFKNGKTHGPVTAIWPGSRLHYFEVMKKVRYEDLNITYRSNNRFQFMGNGYTETEIDKDGNAVWYFDDPFVST
ncbi:FAD/NAD(P)-binding domain-containing protein [Hyaloscypha variabilis F]|uniref:FAD/NAD(P)-binding domain-containing protein n=1 Tax=Hyaloscypha variabilis (strain UAMH 11265 / GT02V1 / F) TaxID=1149755 RepID=A0A2J6QUT0_HYAVF|nr:FAD/NAD(P)-binding domain-containing protein [Hyaloscypha variabilis F]